MRILSVIDTLLRSGFQRVAQEFSLDNHERCLSVLVLTTEGTGVRGAKLQEAGISLASKTTLYRNVMKLLPPAKHLI